MFDEFSEGQPIAYKVIKQIFKTKRINHAYLIKSNNYARSNDFVLSFAKSLLCPFNYTNFEKCDNCDFCNCITNGEFPELRIIRPVGLWIKKEEIIQLQSDFYLKPLTDGKKVYIIFEPEKLNRSSANSLLKFLEEPPKDVIAILVTNNIQNVLSTIISRCQIINLINNNKEVMVENNLLLKLGLLFYQNEEDLKDFIDTKENINKIKAIIDFVYELETNKVMVLLELNSLWYPYIKEKKDYLLAFDIIIHFYKDIINYLILGKAEFFNEYYATMDKIIKINDKTTLLKKINKLIPLRESIKSNINLNLLLDKFILSIGGI